MRLFYFITLCFLRVRCRTIETYFCFYLAAKVQIQALIPEGQGLEVPRSAEVKQGPYDFGFDYITENVNIKGPWLVHAG